MRFASTALISACAATLVLSSAVRGATPAPAKLAPTTVIVNAVLVDGLGGGRRPGAVRVRGDRILEVGDLRPMLGEAVVDARGLVLAPGFIDTHSHGDRGLFEHRDALAAVSQGITVLEQPAVSVAVGVDEAGREHQVAGVHDGLSLIHI